MSDKPSMSPPLDPHTLRFLRTITKICQEYRAAMNKERLSHRARHLLHIPQCPQCKAISDATELLDDLDAAGAAIDWKEDPREYR
jgi:hypothetical protein